MRRLLPLAAAALFAALPAFADDKPKDDAPVVKPKEGKSETIKLFDGKTLDGWEGHENLWSVKDGAIVGKNTDEVKVSTYLVTKKKFSDFLLKSKVKLVDGGPTKMHSGIAVWGHLAPEKGDKYTYMGHLVMFPSGWGMYDLHRRNGLPVDPAPAKKVGKQDDWNDLWILTQGNRIRVAVNGTLVVDWRDPKPDLIEEGVIGLQLHQNKSPQEVHFKDLVITMFPKDTEGWDVKVGEKIKAEDKPKEGESAKELLVGKWEPTKGEKMAVLEFTKDGKILVKFTEDGKTTEVSGTYKFTGDDKIDVELSIGGQSIKDTLKLKVAKDELTTTDSKDKTDTFKRVK